MNTAISWRFLTYFVVLFSERIQSIVRVFCSSAGAFSRPFDCYVNVLTMASLLAAVILLAFFNRGFWHSLFNNSVTPDYTWLVAAAGALLVGGMMHTPFTVAPIQFGAYGALIAAMAVRAVALSGGADSKFKLWYSMIYLTVFSMAIPVVYETTQRVTRANVMRVGLFHATEAAAAIVLVLCFSVMLRLFFIGQGEDLLYWLPLAVMAVADAAIIALGWKDDLNYFIMIFAPLAILLFIAGKIVFRIIAKK